MAGAAQSGGGTELARAEVASRGLGQQVLVAVERGRGAFAAMPAARRTRLIAAATLLAALCAGLVWWSNRTVWKTLYGGLEGRDLQQVESELAAANISYQATPDGLGVEVPAELLDKARMEVAAKGMPQSGRMGFELFDKPNWVGSEFDEKVNYQRALEGELEHTIATLGAVRSARVHLVLAKESLFASEQTPAKASVVLKLKGTAMSRTQIDSVRRLVAGAVEGLTPEQVTLADADGKVNLNAASAEQQGGELEQQLAAKLVEMLEPLAGRDNVRATVTVSFDQGSEERTDEVVDPAQVSAVSVQKRDEQSAAAPKAAGVPGTVSNTPVAGATGSVQPPLPVYPASNGQQQTLHEETATYAVTRHTTHQEQGPGRVQRVTAAVLVNDRSVTEAAGKTVRTVWKPRSAEEMKQLEQLAQAAVGFNSERGDSVVLKNISFEANAPEAAAVGPMKVAEQAQALVKSQPELMRGAGVVLLTMAIILFVVRPVVRQTVALLKPGPASAESQALLAAPGRLHLTENSDVSGAHAVPREAAKVSEGSVMEYVTGQVRKEPVSSARLLESWIGSKESAA